MLAVPATGWPSSHVGRPVPNAALLGGFAALTGLVSLASVEAAIRDRFPAAWPRATSPPRPRRYALVHAATVR